MSSSPSSSSRSRDGAGTDAKASSATGRPTIRDVSRLAGVSRMTVSRVISTPDLVLPATREKVQRAIDSLGYVPDRAAGSLSSRKTGFIALMLPTLTNANFAAVAHGITEVLRERDYHLLVAYTDYDTAEEERQMRALLARRPEAIVITGALHRRSANRMLLAADIPVIEVANLPSQPIEHAIGFSNYEVGRTAARYLIAKGFTRIGALAATPGETVTDHRGEERVRGFEEELAASGLSKDYVLRHGQAPVSFSHGSDAMAALLAAHGDVEAVFAVSDMSAVGAVMECQRRGVAVPEQVSIMGFGDFEIGREINPPLTTIHVDFRALGQRTGHLLLDILATGAQERAPQRIDVGLSLVERASVKGTKSS
ncbi:LacI family DNA-binding transcriptional regulator [Novosphingobium profundi]|uniref:LacI family DNA-binding transcriptional regulator n=1 Tax=Novosphingobium profundi TaxID=1774954 RepID=UPI001BDA4552|nr:LacI family DNA-binding transcriptional regulator [Novosphingobium profundi]MBT0670205.1 LacI family DNA-binding transcriptional regulator [Novosphingobium profundi]